MATLCVCLLENCFHLSFIAPLMPLPNKYWKQKDKSKWRTRDMSDGVQLKKSSLIEASITDMRFIEVLCRLGLLSFYYSLMSFFQITLENGHGNAMLLIPNMSVIKATRIKMNCKTAIKKRINFFFISSWLHTYLANLDSPILSFPWWQDFRSEEVHILPWGLYYTDAYYTEALCSEAFCTSYWASV